jgi:hypothetical protein
MIATRLLAAVAGVAALACAVGRRGTTVDLMPFAWTWSQVSLGDTLIRYGHPDEPAQPGDAQALALAPIGPGASDYDSHGREWYHRVLALESGGALAHYSRPIDADAWSERTR